jgi:sugar phosphate permease
MEFFIFYSDLEKKMEEQNDEPQLKPHNWVFYVHAVSILVLGCLAYSLAFFHRSLPAVVSADLSKEFNVSVTSLTIYSSMYFWVYGVLQPFSGLLADVIDPAYLIGSAVILSALGSLTCGLAGSLGVSIFGRFLVGFGCACVYVPICRLLTRWYPIKWYPVLAGVLLASGGIGGMVSQGPLQAFNESLGWRAAFFGISGIGFVIGVLILFVVRLDPKNFGYQIVNAISNQKEVKMTIKERLILLWRNFVVVATKPLTYVFSVFHFFINGVYFSFASFWGGPYLRDSFPEFNAGTMLMSCSIAMVVGAIGLPFISNALRTRKWVLEANAVIATILSIIFATLDKKMSYGVMFFCLMIWTINTGAVSSVGFTAVRENFDPSVTTTCLGFVNFIAFIGGAVIQEITGAILKATVDYETTKYPHSSYTKAIWIPNAIMCGIGLFEQPFVPDKLQLSDKDLKAGDEVEVSNIDSDPNKKVSSSDSDDGHDEIKPQEL